MSDEEKKAIDYLQFCYSISTISNESLPKLGIVLNLIEKQSKEIEELKENQCIYKDTSSCTKSISLKTYIALNKSDSSKEQSSMNYYNLYKELVNKIKVEIEELKKRKK